MSLKNRIDRLVARTKTCRSGATTLSSLMLSEVPIDTIETIQDAADRIDGGKWDGKIDLNALGLSPKIWQQIESAWQWASDHAWLTKLPPETYRIVYNLRHSSNRQEGSLCTPIRLKDFDAMAAPVWTPEVRKTVANAMIG